MRIAIPAGFMPMFSGNSVTIQLCSGYGPMTMAMPGMADHHDKQGEHGKQDVPCGFAGLAAPSLAGADPILLAIAIAFVIASGFLPIPPRRVALPFYLRPPLRGPPTTA